MKRAFLHNTACFFALLFIVFIPFPFTLTRVQGPVSDFIFGRLIGVIADHIFHQPLRNTHIYSDSLPMYILTLLLLLIAMVIAFLVQRWKKWSAIKQKVYRLLATVFVYYLALQLMKYGVDKIFKNQFYLPEPNILYTPLGDVDRDLLYWSSMGTSYTYSLFMGILETGAALLLVFRKTRLIGLLAGLGIMINVVAVNIGFDISVKLFAIFLLYLAIYLLVPYRQRLVALLVIDKQAPANPAPENPYIEKDHFILHVLKWLAIMLLLFETLFPFIRTGNFNGDKVARPLLHGAYAVEQMIVGKDTLSGPNTPLKRVFVHKDSYFILQDQQDQLRDYKLSYDQTNALLILTNYDMSRKFVHFMYADSILQLRYLTKNDSTRIIARQLDWKKMPALKAQFHWIAE